MSERVSGSRPRRSPTATPRRRETVGDAVARRRAAGGFPEAAPATRRRPRRDPETARSETARPETVRPAPAGSSAPRRPPLPPSPVHRRRRRVAALVAGVLLLVGLAVGGRVLLYDLGLADVEDVQVTGTAVVPVDAVLAAAAVVPGVPLASVHAARIEARVGEIGGVAAVDVGRSWPHTVTVEVTERTPVAVTETPQGVQPVDAGGVVYPAPVAAALPRLAFAGVGPQDPGTRAALDVLAALPEPLWAQVQTVDVETGGGTVQVSLGLTEDRLVRWGQAQRAPEKASVLMALLSRPGRVYDVTSPDLPTVRS